MATNLPRILVTGGTGFLGSEVVRCLLETKKYEVTVIDINPPSLGTGSFPSVHYLRCNVLALEEVRKVFTEARPAIIIHTVGVYPPGQKRYNLKKNGKEWNTVLEVNIQGTKNVIEAAKECGAKGLVYTSSVTVLVDELDADFKNADETWSTGRATTPYGISKTISENLVLSANDNGFATCSLRCAPIFGPNDFTVVPTIHGLIARGETNFVVGDGTNLVDFVYVSNVADAHILAAQSLLRSGPAAGQAFFITNGEPVTGRDFCLAIWKEFGHVPSHNVSIPRALAWWLGWGAEWASFLTRTEGTMSRGAIMDATSTRYMNIGKARRTLGYVPKVGLAEGLRISCQHYKEQLKAQTYSKEEVLG